MASSITRTCCRSPVAFLARSNEERDGRWGVRGKSEYDEGSPKRGDAAVRLEMEMRKCWPTFEKFKKKKIFIKKLLMGRNVGLLIPGSDQKKFNLLDGICFSSLGVPMLTKSGCGFVRQCLMVVYHEQTNRWYVLVQSCRVSWLTLNG